MEPRIGGSRQAGESESYRYANIEGGRAKLTAIDLPEDVTGKCVRLATDLGLEFAGIDLFRSVDAEYYCFEVNPQPAFSFFDHQSGQPIARAVADYLAGAV
jgi:glutathione synthase/RimK-type ligase-like ATP-grasp enzyme